MSVWLATTSQCITSSIFKIPAASCTRCCLQLYRVCRRPVAGAPGPHLTLASLCATRVWSKPEREEVERRLGRLPSLHSLCVRGKNLVRAKRKWRRWLVADAETQLSRKYCLQCTLRWLCVTPVSHSDSDSYANYRCELLLSCHCGRL